MAGVTLGNVLPSLATASGKNLSNTILDLVFRDSALLIKDPTAFYTYGATPVMNDSLIPLPIVGFTFQQPESLEVLKYSYAEYPYLNRAVVANSFQRDTTTITIKALRPIMRGNAVITNFITNQLLLLAIEKYADNGGLFSLVTMWGYVNDLALESVVLEPVEGQGGVGWSFTFKKLNFASVALGESVSSKLAKIYSGAG